MKQNEIFEAIKKRNDDEAAILVRLYTHNFSNPDLDDLSSHEGDLDVNIQDETGKTLLHYAVERTLFKTVARLLGEKNANTEILDNKGDTPLLSVIWSVLDEEEKMRMIRMLVEAGANPTAFNQVGFDCFLLSATLGNLELVAYFLESGKVDINQQHKYTGETSMHRAISENHPEVLKQLLAYGANPEIRDNKRRTPLDNAKKLGRTEMVGILEGSSNSNTQKQALSNFSGSTSSSPLFFSEDPIPKELKEILRNTWVQREYIDKGYTTLNELIDLYQTKPWVVSAFLASNIKQGIQENRITIEQLCSLPEEKVLSLKHRFSGEQLSMKVEAYLSEQIVNDI